MGRKSIGKGATRSRLTHWNWKIPCFLIYLALLVSGLLMIETRVGPIWRNGKFADRIPLFVAAYNWLFDSERMQYVATSDMKINHQLLRSDFTLPAISETLYDYFPRIDDIRGKYLKKDITAGKPIFLNDLSPYPLIDPQPDTYVVNIRLSKQAAPKGYLEPKSTVVIVPKDSTDKLEGTVLSSTWEDAPSPSPTKATENKKPSPAPASPVSQTGPSPNN